MSNLNINMENVNETMARAITPHLENQVDRITIGTNDIEYIDHLIKKGELQEAKNMLHNIKSVAKIINSQIMEIESYLASMEV